MTRMSSSCSPLRSWVTSSERVWARTIRPSGAAPGAGVNRPPSTAGAVIAAVRPVSSRKTSSRVRRSTASRSGITPWAAHQAVTVASSWGSMGPATR